MKRFLFKVAYIGKYFSGFQRQPNGQAVENFLEWAFIKAGYVQSFLKNNYRAMSRTDFGVSALSNVFAVYLKNSPNLYHLNHLLPNGIVLWAYAEINENFDPRNDVIKKTYLYRLYDLPQEIKSQISRVIQYKGFYNFHNFIRSDGAGEENPYSNIHVRVNKTDNEITIYFIGDKFGREQVRRMVGLIINKRFLHINPSDLLNEVNATINIEPAPAEFLVLYNAEFKDPVQWIYPNIDDLYIFGTLRQSTASDYYSSKFLFDIFQNPLE